MLHDAADPGEPISLVLDGADSSDVTGSFSYDVGSYQSGAVDLDLPSLPFGAHTIEFGSMVRKARSKTP